MSLWSQITDALAREFSDVGDAGVATRVGVRLLTAALLGGAIGWERESVGKSAGLRTHMLVALGSALFILAPVETGEDEQATSRVIQGVVAGIGFLGAGAIVKSHAGDAVYGLTTAASIWITAALGMAVALGRVVTAIIAAVLALVILHVLPSATPNDNSRRNPKNHPDSS